MLRSLEMLFTLQPSAEFGALFAIIDLVDSEFGSNPIQTKHLISRIEAYSVAEPSLGRFDTELVKSIQGHITSVLSDDAPESISQLIHLLDGYNTRNLA